MSSEENNLPKAPKIDLSKIQNAEAIKKKGDDTFEKALPSGRTRKKGKFNFINSEKCRLPSGGILYSSVTDDPDVLSGEIELYPMTVKEEEILSTSKFLKSGAATRMVIDNCIASDIDAKDILLYDSNYILFFLRSISYGDDYEFKLKCPNCDQEFEHTVEISQLSFEELPEDITEPIKTKLPASGYTVYSIFPRLFHSEMIYQRSLKKKKKTSDSDTRLVDNLMSTIVKIVDTNGEEVEKRDYEEFLEALPGMDRAALKDATDYSTGVDKLNGVACPYCETDYSGTIPVGIDFFRF